MTQSGSPAGGPRDVARWAFRAALALNARMRHRRRRQRAEEALASHRQPGSLLFVCTGNVCRSPYAERAFLRVLEPPGVAGMSVGSAGFLKAGRPSPQAAVRIAAERGIALVEHRSRELDEELVERSEIVIVMDAGHQRRLRRFVRNRETSIVLLGDLDPELPSRLGILDPWGRDDDVYRKVFARIDRCVDRLAFLILPLPASVE